MKKLLLLSAFGLFSLATFAHNNKNTKLKTTKKTSKVAKRSKTITVMGCDGSMWLVTASCTTCTSQDINNALGAWLYDHQTGGPGSCVNI